MAARVQQPTARSVATTGENNIRRLKKGIRIAFLSKFGGFFMGSIASALCPIIWIPFWRIPWNHTSAAMLV